MLIKGGNANLTVAEVLKDIVSCWTQHGTFNYITF